ncbi:hypothetical protein IYY11_02300 [Methylocystis sp. H62]|uniref:hypothetical protein n=1 Tax=Methylocystis sp. H62 TaxID=2785789 RepID=UPI0018C20E59|nr:hypothetical protein [Methylocystis sp. H62]MBG0792299.1 hypothetical protein [Methylocystis sp. H62]
MNDERSHLTPAAVALLAETDSLMNFARIKENGVSEKTPMQTFIDALPLAPPLEPPTGQLMPSVRSSANCTVDKTGRNNQSVSERHERATPIWIRSAYLPYVPAAL